MTTVCACEKTVVIVKQPGHLTSIKKDRGAGTRFLSLCLRASAAGVGLRRSTARTILTVRSRDLYYYGVTDGSFVDCAGVEDVESECQSLSMVEGGRIEEESIVKGKTLLASRISKFGGRCDSLSQDVT